MNCTYPDASRIIERQHQFVFRIDDEDATNGERQVLLVAVPRINHAIGGRNVAFGISNDGKTHVNLIVAHGVHVFKPLGVRVDWIDAQSGDLAVQFVDQLVVFRSET